MVPCFSNSDNDDDEKQEEHKEEEEDYLSDKVLQTIPNAQSYIVETPAAKRRRELEHRRREADEQNRFGSSR